MDNITAVSQKGHTISKQLRQIPIIMWTSGVGQNISLIAEYLPSQLNSEAEEESRITKDRCDWKLNQAVFQRSQEVMGPTDVDLLVSDKASSFNLRTSTAIAPKGSGKPPLHGGMPLQEIFEKLFL